MELLEEFLSSNLFPYTVFAVVLLLTSSFLRDL